MAESDRFLVIRADDAGSAIGANRAIREVLRAGVVTAVGFMAVAPAFADAVITLRPHLDAADIGVHATLNAEWETIRWGPLSLTSEIPSLVAADGTFFPHPRDLQTRCSPAEAVVEIRRQIHAIRDAGLDPVYLDTHMGIDRLPGMASALSTLAAEEGLRFTARQPDWVPYSGGGAEWLAAIRQLPPGRHQLITHPGSDTEDLRAFFHAGLEPGQVARERAAETELLRSVEFKNELQRAGIKLVRFSDLA